MRTEGILKRSDGNFTTLVNCIKKQVSLVKNIGARRPNYNKLFVAADFTAFGSQSPWVSEARSRATLLLNHLNELFQKIIFFQPHFYNLRDKGAVAIVAGADSGFFLGGGALVYRSTSAPINHVFFFFFWLNTSCIRKTAGHIREGCAPPAPSP